MTTDGFYHSPPGQVHNSEADSLVKPSAPALEPPGFQLAEPDIVHQTRPGLFDEMPSHLLTDAHRTLEAWPHAGDRMMLPPLLPVSLQAQRVASGLLWHGWSSIPSRERLSAFTQISDLSNISKALTELQNAGILSKRPRTDSGRGYAGNRYTFCGLVICQFLVNCCHPPLAATAQAILDYHAALNEAENSRGVCDTPRATEDVAEGENSRGVRDTPRATESQADGENTRRVGDTPRPTENKSRGVRGTLRDSRGESEFVARRVRGTPPGGYDIPYNHDDDLIDKEKNNLIQSIQSINEGSRGVRDTPRGMAPGEGRSVSPTSRGDPEDVCSACGSDEFNGEVCSACGVQSALPDSALAWPGWYRDFASRLPPQNVPDWQDVDQDRQVSGWSHDILRESATRYERRYAGERVSSPLALFRTIAESVASERLRSRRGRGGSAGGARHSGGPRDPGRSLSEQSVSAEAQVLCTCAEIAAAAAAVPDPEAQAMWAKTLEALAPELAPTSFDAWLKDSEGVRRDGGNLVVRVASVFTIAWIEDRAYQSIIRALRDCCGPAWDVNFEVSAQAICRVHGSSGLK